MFLVGRLPIADLFPKFGFQSSREDMCALEIDVLKHKLNDYFLAAHLSTHPCARCTSSSMRVE